MFGYEQMDSFGSQSEKVNVKHSLHTPRRLDTYSESRVTLHLFLT